MLFLSYQPDCHKFFAFSTTTCSLKLTQRILTFFARRSLRTTKFVVCRCRFANDFFSVKLLHVDHQFTGDIIGKCELPIFMQGILTVGEIQLGKNL